MFVKVKCECCNKIDKSYAWSRKHANKQKLRFNLNGYKCVECYVKSRDTKLTI